MIAPKRRLTNHALHGREEWFKRIFRDQIAEAAGILEVVLSGIVLVALLSVRIYSASVLRYGQRIRLKDMFKLSS